MDDKDYMMEITGEEEAVDGDGKETVIEMEYPLHFCWIDESIGKLQGEGKARLREECLVIESKHGETYQFSYREMKELKDEDYTLQISLDEGNSLTLFYLGRLYRDFVKSLYKCRDALVMEDMLVKEALINSFNEAEYIYVNENGIEAGSGVCGLHIYETALVIVPRNGETSRIPYSFIKELEEEDYRLNIVMDSGERYTFLRMGRNFSLFVRNLNQAMSQLSMKIQSFLLKEFPDLKPSMISKVSRYMKDGKAVKKEIIEEVAPGFWRNIEKRLEAIGIQEEYEFLKSIARQDKMSIGMKRGLMGELTGEYLWFLIPIYSNDTKKPGNAIAMEASTGDGKGKATYFFRIISRKEYPLIQSLDRMDQETDLLIKALNYGMYMVNFRREPIYLSERKLADPQYSKYQYTIERIPALRMLREHFIGRVIHTSVEQWKRDVMNLLQFNVSSQNDDDKYRKDS